MPFLSICIPTYNQSAAVDCLLNAIVEQWRSDIEVVICDDSQSDDTGHIVNNYAEFIPIKYVKRERSGLDSAVINLTDIATGDYVWWIGDDKILADGVTTVVDFLKKRLLIFSG